MWKHGTQSSYNVYGCRCTACTAAHREAFRRRRIQQSSGPYQCNTCGHRFQTANGMRIHKVKVHKDFAPS